MPSIPSKTRAQIKALMSRGSIAINHEGLITEVSVKDMQRYFGGALDVADNTAKLALVGSEMNPGQIVRVVGSSNRLEMWNGGTTSSEDSWKVIA